MGFSAKSITDSSFNQLQRGHFCGDLPSPPELYGNLLHQNGQVGNSQKMQVILLQQSIMSKTHQYNWKERNFRAGYNLDFINKNWSIWGPIEIVTLCAYCLENL